MKIAYTFILLFFAATVAFAHSFGYVKGIVLDDQTNEPIASATVVVNQFTTTTKADGTFILSEIPEGKYQLTIEKDGFQSKAYPLSILKDKTTGKNNQEIQETLVHIGRLKVYRCIC